MGRLHRPRLAALLAGLGVTLAGCSGPATPTARPAPEPASPLGADALIPSPRLIIGRIVAVDPARKFAFVEVETDAPAAALAAGETLLTRTPALRETGQLRVSRQRRGRTLGTQIVSGQPSANDEVVWLAP